MRVPSNRNAIIVLRSENESLSGAKTRFRKYRTNRLLTRANWMQIWCGVTTCTTVSFSPFPKITDQNNVGLLQLKV